MAGSGRVVITGGASGIGDRISHTVPVTRAMVNDRNPNVMLWRFQVSMSSGNGSPHQPLAKVPQQLQTDQAMRHLMGDFAREVAKLVP